jgi:hypothetical protein
VFVVVLVISGHLIIQKCISETVKATAKSIATLQTGIFQWTIMVLMQKKKPVISNTSHFFCFNNSNTVSYTYKEFELYDDDCRKTKHSELCFKTLLIDLDTNIYKMTKHFTKLFSLNTIHWT